MLMFRSKSVILW